jgi:hypothetical protein
VHRQSLQVRVNGQTEAEAEHAHDDAKQQQIMTGHAVEESNLCEVWEF